MIHGQRFCFRSSSMSQTTSKKREELKRNKAYLQLVYNIEINKEKEKKESQMKENRGTVDEN